MSEEKIETTKTETTETKPAPATAEAAQAALIESDKRPTLLTDSPVDKPADAPAAFDAEKLTIPEGFTPEKETLSAFAEIAKGIPHETAQKLVQFYADQQKKSSEISLNFWKETRDKWENEARSWSDDEVKNARFQAGDKTLTGLDAMVQTVAKVLDNPQLTDPKFREALEFTGIGSHPAAIRTLYRWASQLVEGSATGVGGVPDTVGSKNAEDARNKSAASILYPNLPSGA